MPSIVVIRCLSLGLPCALFIRPPLIDCPPSDAPPVFRFAPSPNGYLHLGHALSALENSDRARAAGGRLLLRIEDIDAARCRPEFEAAIYEDLAWLGLAWEEPVRRQSEHLDDYRAVLDRLTRAGLIYPSFESRGEILRLIAERDAQAPWPRDPDGTPLYPGVGQRFAGRRAGAPHGARSLHAAAR
jgi:Glutamyl- and glutaminyl-tRNA synthetases